jgi:hypothetical protein
MPSILAPAGYTPEFAVSFSGAGGAVRVDRDNPLPMSEPSFRGATPIVADVEQPAGRGVAIVTRTGGDAALKLADGSVIVLPVTAGLAILPFAVTTVVAAQTTALATFVNLA